MNLHLVKLCVGIESADDLIDRVTHRLGEARARGRDTEHTHTTRMIPQRKEALLDGGSLYWVIRGSIQVRQRLLDIRPFRDEAGIRRCHLVLEPVFVLTRPQPRRPFQGWRYLYPADAPADFGDGDPTGAMPMALRRDLVELGLL